ncbi:hypothetical protein [Mycobacterium kiyosense]|uniref:hypothetical protein n=1 Tax=Mycobacterium kiyosense TaxID=2871094 RepID=UPI00222FCAF7|nr:hypothetical protein [Mycobacterium kiyosense]GLC04262.1 hypothetical protein SRL2020400_48530 [Mycobacterium kiyosense]GLC18669.1 hypothetical protein SRL2020472_12400 [Mycobacterium kiyosense]
MNGAVDRDAPGAAPLLMGIAGISLGCTVFGAIVLGTAAVIAGLAGWRRAKRGEAPTGAKVIGGIVAGLLAIACGILSIVLAMVYGVAGLVFLWAALAWSGGALVGVGLVTGFAMGRRARNDQARHRRAAMGGSVLGFLVASCGLVLVAVWISTLPWWGAHRYFNCLADAGTDRTKIDRCRSDFSLEINGKNPEYYR